MVNDAFALFIRDTITAGEQQLAGMTRSVIGEIDPTMVAALDRRGGDGFLEPLLFALICDPDPAVEPAQILLGYLHPSERPAELDVRTDSEGILYLPQIGSFATGMPDRWLRLVRDAVTGRYDLFDGPLPVLSPLEAPRDVADGGIEVVRGKHPLLDRYFVDLNGQTAQYETGAISAQQTRNLARAFDIIAQVHPVYSESIRAVTRAVVIFHSDPLNSFATLSVHGAAFLNTSPHDDEVFFIEDLAHQCGHIVFNALTFETEDYLLVPQDTPLRIYNGLEDETRSVYDAFHGIFTEAMMYECLNECYLQGVFEGKQEQELIGRMGFILSRFALDLNMLARQPIFTERGAWLLANIARIFKAGYDAHWQGIAALKFSNQGYNFSYEKFLAANGEVVM